MWQASSVFSGKQGQGGAEGQECCKEQPPTLGLSKEGRCSIFRGWGFRVLGPCREAYVVDQ